MKVGCLVPSDPDTVFSFVEYKEIRLPLFITASCVK